MACSFYKIMVSPTTQLLKLRLPKSFTSAYGNELADTCKLTVPTGETFRVALVNEGNTLWFGKGWDEFVDRFSISYGYFMAFTYHGNSSFGVNLFDLSTCEISYQCDDGDKATSSLMQDVPYHGFSNDDGCEEGVEVEELDTDDKVSEESSDTTLSDTTSSDTTSDTEEESEESPQSGIVELPLWLRRYGEEIKAVTAAEIPIPVNPFFVVLINQYCLPSSSKHSSSYLTIPIAFARDHLKRKGGGNVRVEMSQREHWTIRFRTARSYYFFGKGWNQFALEAGLKVGDVCLFELIDAENSVLKVSVARSS